jgi:hypothetical protein
VRAALAPPPLTSSRHSMLATPRAALGLVLPNPVPSRLLLLLRVLYLLLLLLLLELLMLMLLPGRKGRRLVQYT